MSANVETMAYTGEVPWHNLGTAVDHAMSSEEALQLAHLNWNVLSKEVFVDGAVAVGYRANVRDFDGKVFGIVSNRYKIVQNFEAFAFTDYLLKNDLGIPVTYETAGALDSGKKIWLLAKLPEKLILGDAIVPYMVFVNSHDGLGSIKVAMVPTRVVCQNTLTLALKEAMRTWSTKHVGTLDAKIQDAKATLQLANMYMTELEIRAENMQQKHLNDNAIQNFINLLFPLNNEMSERQVAATLAQRQMLEAIIDEKEDLKKFKNTAWGVYNAVADYESHLLPRRASDKFRERQFASFIDTNTRLKTAEHLLSIV